MISPQLLVFLLILLRTVGVVGTAPILGNTQVPTTWKVGFSVFLALMVDTNMTLRQLLPGGVANLTFPVFIAMAVRETLVGMALGFMMGLVFSAVEFAGSLLDIQVGLSIASIVSPGLIGPVTILSNLEYILFTMWFLAVNGHYAIILAILESFRILPLGVASFSGSLAEVMVKGTADLLVLGLQMAAPVMLALFITNVSLAVASRAVQQLNVFAIGLPVSLLVGFLMLSSVMPDFAYAFQGLLATLESGVNEALQAMGGL